MDGFQNPLKFIWWLICVTICSVFATDLLRVHVLSRPLPYLHTNSMNSMNYILHYFNIDSKDDIPEAEYLFILILYLYSTTIWNRNYISARGLQDPSSSLGQHLYLHGT